MTRLRSLAAAACTGAALALIAPPDAAALERVPAFGPNPGNLEMYVHVPASPEPGMPLVVALHGCTQTAADFDDETGLVALAEETPFLLLLPQQSADNMALRCFRWYDDSENRPGEGESASILAMIDSAIGGHAVDPGRVFVMGLSAGGAMTAVMLANYPDRFAGGGIIAGVPFDCNRPVNMADMWWWSLHWSPLALDGADASWACGIRGFGATDRDPAEWGGYVRDAAQTTPAAWPPVSIWQGTGDDTVDPDNLRELVEQWTDVHGIDAVPDLHEIALGASHDVYRDANGAARVEAWSLPGFPHAVPIDADGDPAACGVVAGYTVDADLCAVRRIAAFWGLAPAP
jgi:poly(3-hydroxybutyrate) depolymerase